jgi:hypothetical protein
VSPNLLTGSARGKPKIRASAVTIGYLLAELHAGASSVKELSAASGLSLATVRDYLREFKKRKLVHIAGYDRNSQNSPSITLYQWNPGAKDAKMPKMTPAEKAKLYRKNKRERAIRQRLTSLGQGAGYDPAQEVDGPPPALDLRPDHCQQQVL